MTLIFAESVGCYAHVSVCCRDGCVALCALSKSHYERALRTKETFFCNQGHPQHFTDESKEERVARLKWEAEVQRLRSQSEQDRRLREEAERRAGEAEKERIAAKRDAVNVKRILKNATKTSAKLVSTKGRDRGRSHKKKVQEDV